MTEPAGFSSDANASGQGKPQEKVKEVEKVKSDEEKLPEAGGDQLAQRRRRGEAALGELVEQYDAGRSERVETDEVAQRERTHRVRRAGLHRHVDLADRPDALLERAHAVEQVGDQQAVDDEAGRVLRLDRQLAEPLAELDADGERLVRGRDALDDLDAASSPGPG